MSSSRLSIFIIISLVLHAAVFSAILLLSPVEPDELARPLMVGVTTRYDDPGRGKGSSLDPAPAKEPEKKAEKPVEKKAVKKTVKKKPAAKSEKKEIISQNNVSVTERTAASSPVTPANATEGDSVSPEGRGKGTGLGERGSGLDTSGSGEGTEIGYPNYGVNPKPDYPRIAKRHGYEGLVVLNVFVMESGNVGKVEIRKSSGYDVLDNSALDAVRKWVFIPGKKNGRAVPSWVVVPIRFDLTNG
ncbi:MAG: energy transducer TonB [Candidatus Dadabacteria bacterium]|nr:MAG: energy transducer TonB [Candidatus Dadabacteria bacterium]